MSRKVGLAAESQHLQVVEVPAPEAFILCFGHLALLPVIVLMERGSPSTYQNPKLTRLMQKIKSINTMKARRSIMVRWLLVLVLVVCSLQPACGAALVHGTIYQWDTLEPLPDVVIEANTTPHQMMVSKTGTYSLLLENGTYEMEFSYIVDGIPTLGASERIAVRSNGDYVLDVLLFPLNESTPEFSEMSEDSEDGFAWIALPVAALLLCLMLYAAYAKGWLAVRRAPLRKGVHEDDTLGEGVSSLPDDLTQALEIIEQAGGRITQRELRKKLGGSEAKVSLLISELVHRGLVEKVKVGRGNVIYLKK